MAKTNFAWVNAVDAATSLVATSESPDLPAANLQSLRTGRVWRPLTNIAGFTCTFSAVTNIDVLALGGCTLASTDQIRHRLFDAAGATLLDVTVSSGVLEGHALHVYKIAATQAAKSWQCDITGTSRAAKGFFDIKRAFAAPVWRPAVGIVRPWDRSWNDDAAKSRSPYSGAVLAGDGARYRTLNVSLGWMEDSDVVQAESMSYTAGVRGQVLCIPDEDGNMPREAILGRMDKVQPIRQSKDTVPPVYEQTFSIVMDL